MQGLKKRNDRIAGFKREMEAARANTSRSHTTLASGTPPPMKITLLKRRIKSAEEESLESKLEREKLAAEERGADETQLVLLAHRR